MRNPTRRGGRSAAAPFHPVVLAEGLEPRTLLSATDPLDVKNGPLAKVGPELIGAWNQFQNLLRSRGPAATAGFRPSDPLLHLGAGGGIEIEAYTNGNPATLAAELASLGAKNVQSYANGASAAVPAAEISALAALPDLNFARPVEFTLNTGSVTSQGDSVLRGDVGRNQFSVNGSGVKVGVLSDSFNTASNTFTTDHYSTDVASGDLPAGVQVLQDTPGGTDEGRAMAQLVYDTAPGASLAFATAYNSQASFATNIKALRDAGCKVIVDDVSYFAEPMFQDGVIAQAVDNVVASGASYFSAVGNEASQSYQDAFRPDRTLASGSISPSFRGGVTHDFDPGPGVDDTQGFTLAPGADITLSFEWDQPFFSVSGGSGSANDMDVYVLNAGGTKVLAAGTTQNTGGDPVEVVSLTNSSRTTTQSYQLMIVKASGSAPGLMKYVDYGSASFSEWTTNSSTDYGHSNAAGAAGVAAARYSNPTSAESYSSLGGTPILFDTAGNRLATQVTRQSPRFTAPDGGNTTFFYPGDDFEGDGHPNFFGTSAAAPAAAAVAALMLQLNPSMSPASVYSILQSTAQDMGTAGYDFLTGSGLIRADAAIASELGITASGGAAYQVTGSPGSRLLSVTAGTVTLGKDLSSFYPGISLSVSGAATAVFSVDQTFFNVTLADNGQISVGTPPAGRRI